MMMMMMTVVKNGEWEMLPYRYECDKVLLLSNHL